MIYWIYYFRKVVLEKQLHQAVVTVCGLSSNKPVTSSSSNTTHSSNCVSLYVCVCVCVSILDCFMSAVGSWIYPLVLYSCGRRFCLMRSRKALPSITIHQLHVCVCVCVRRGLFKTPFFGHHQFISSRQELTVMSKCTNLILDQLESPRFILKRSAARTRASEDHTTQAAFQLSLQK